VVDLIFGANLEVGIGVGKSMLFSCWNFWNSTSRSKLPLVKGEVVVGPKRTGRGEADTCLV
jgi:hypothetical protein